MSIKKNGTRMPIPWDALIIIVAIAVIGIGRLAVNHFQHAREIRNAPREEKVVVARVNGEPIYESAVDRGLPSHSFSDTVYELRQNKVARLISQVAVRQFLDEQDVRIPEERVDKEIKKLEKNPPSQGCACCTYPSLDAYLATVGYTRDDLRREIRNSLGLSDYAQASWKKSHPSKSDALKKIGTQSKFIRSKYVNVWQIFFNTFQQPGYDSNPDRIRESVGRKAKEAWDRLQQGESFDAVAGSMSEDMTSKRQGGSLGAIDRSSYGREFDDMISTLKPGEISRPFESSWGYHIIKWQPVSDDDIVELCESYFVDEELKKTYSRIMKEAKVERPKSDENGQ